MYVRPASTRKATSNFSAKLTEIEPNHMKRPGESLPGLFLEKSGSMVLNDLPEFDMTRANKMHEFIFPKGL